MPPEFEDPYVYPGTQVLRNKPGIRDGYALRQFEYEQTALRIADLREHPVAGKFDLQHLRDTHAQVFQDVYEWAGQIRSINFSKGGSVFARTDTIFAEAKRLHEGLVKENRLHGLEKNQFVERFAHYFAEWNALHPFREGNGRSTREFFGQLAREAGYELDQTRIDNSKDQWNEAARLSFNGNLAPVKAIFTQAVRPSRALAFEKLPEAEALAKHPELNGAFEYLHALRTAAQERYPGNEKAAHHFAAQARSEVLRRLDKGKILRPSPEKPLAQEKPPQQQQRTYDRER